jgi:hypothetical protein
MEREVLERVQRLKRARVSVLRELFDPSAIDGDQSELARDEESVDEYEKKHGEETQRDLYLKASSNEGAPGGSPSMPTIMPG